MTASFRRQETERIRAAYARRDASGKAALYAWNRADTHLTQYRVRATVARLFVEEHIQQLTDRDFLDVGCGDGAWLRLMQEWGAEPCRLHGVDVLANRIVRARSLAPHIDYRHSEGWPLPFDPQSIDVVSAHTVFSSVLDPDSRRAVAREMMRVARSDGIIILYDFRVSRPSNPDTIGIGISEVRRLFPGMSVKRRLVTLAPPIQRLLARVSPALAHAVEAAFPFLRTHAVYVLRHRGK